MTFYEYTAPCHFGMESILKREILNLGYEIVRVEDGRVSFRGDALAIARANVFLRTAERVLLTVGRFKAYTFDELFEQTKALPWEEYLPSDGKFWVKKASTTKSKLFSSSDIQSIVKKAIVERLKQTYRLDWFKEDGAEYPFIFIAPQCPHAKYWGCYTESLIAFIDEMIEILPVDTSRVYLTGLSMGGTGTWMLAMACPEKWAAIAPVCGTGICWNASILKDIPIHVYHGDGDPTVPIAESMQMISRVNAAGGNARITIVYGKGHGSWEEAYGDDILWKWMLSHKKEEVGGKER